MKLFFLGTSLLALITMVPPATAEVDVHVSIGLPPPIVFASPPELIVLPETYVYVVPDLEVDIFFYHGWWWRPWEGRWYRSRDYSTGWVYYQSVPSFYTVIPPGWRNDFRERRWRSHPWNYQRIPHHQIQRNWRGWERERHWERQQTWGVQGLQPSTRSPQPSREVQPRQPRPQLREVDRERPPQFRQSGPQSRDAVNQQRRSGQQSREGQPQQSRKKSGKHKKDESEQ